MLKAMIVEDEYLAREELAYLIGKHGNIDIVASFDDGLEAFKYLQNHSVDIVFLDIQIPSIDGMLLARNIHQFRQPPRIVFTTAYKEFAVDAFELEAFDYLLKPISESRINSLLDKLTASAEPQAAIQTSAPPLQLNLQRDGRIHITPVTQLCYAQADEKITRVFTAAGEFTLPLTISELTERLPANDFFRCHRSYCVQLAQIREIIPWVNSTYLLKLKDVPGEIPVSRSNLKTFRELMQL
ncbi:DNA-binding response regulator [Shewanella sp. NFH-SH190041]|uniref:LytR/AlgR family response regulator transcription factor n=1 Tax=Shewanella sp. NFH-SH190041 TaxID=2950245 RepID=UPI0021C263B9|nr:LytTR family DNA-binding domain-containing protein [Shewanella sp. NFH-SH190041]BDM63148.1 DNA-binding response regulator [Shewanella sp. NFH-SH190041]